MIRDLLAIFKEWFNGMDINNKIVINPLGAINSNGFAGNLNSFKNVALKTNIPTVIAIDQIKVSVFNNSEVSIE